MKRFTLAALMLGSALVAAAPANAAIIISYSVNGGAITQLATDAASPGSASYTGTTGGYYFNVGGTGTPITNPYDLLTQSINIQNSAGTAGTLNVFVTDTGLTGVLTGSLQSSFTTNLQSNVTARITSFDSASNTPNGGTQLQTALFNSIGTFVGSNLVNLTGPFSTTVRYDLTFGNGSGNFNGTGNLVANPVPEPATWGMMIMGFGLLGAVVRRRKTTVAFA